MWKKWQQLIQVDLIRLNGKECRILYIGNVGES